MKEVKMQLLGVLMDVLAEAEGGSAEATQLDTKWLEWPTLAQYEAHVKGEHSFSAEEIRVIESDPRRRWMFGQAQSVCRPSYLERIIDTIRSLVGPGQPYRLEPVGGQAASGESVRYPLVIERPDGTVTADSHRVTANLAPAFTQDGFLVGQISLPLGVLEESSKRGNKTELRIIAISPKIEELANLEATSKLYFKIPVPSPFRDDEQWKSISPGGSLPFVFGLRSARG
jgi:hypothetical protein